MTGEPLHSYGSRNMTVSAPGFTPIFMPSLLRALIYSFPEPSQIKTPLSLWLSEVPFSSLKGKVASLSFPDSYTLFFILNIAERSLSIFPRNPFL